jgi:hypothetical protein
MGYNDLRHDAGLPAPPRLSRPGGEPLSSPWDSPPGYWRRTARSAPMLERR